MDQTAPITQPVFISKSSPLFFRAAILICTLGMIVVSMSEAFPAVGRFVALAVAIVFSWLMM